MADTRALPGGVLIELLRPDQHGVTAVVYLDGDTDARPDFVAHDLTEAGAISQVAATMAKLRGEAQLQSVDLATRAERLASAIKALLESDR